MKVSPSAPKSTITMTTSTKKKGQNAYAWWKSSNKQEMVGQFLSTAEYLKETQNHRQRSASIYARLYGNQSLLNFIGSNMSKMDQSTGLPSDRPTFNLVQSCTDTLVSRISQSRPAPVFLTDNSDYKERNLAKKLNNFILGEFYQTKAYEKSALILRDALVLGTGVLKIFESEDHRVELERVLCTEILTDPNEGIYGNPRQLYQIKLVDRQVLKEMVSGKAKEIVESASAAFADNSADASKTVSDLVMVVEGWHLRSGKDAKDGRHIIAVSTGAIIDEPYDKDVFPFVFLHYSPRLLGFWAQGLAEQLMGTQIEVNSLLYTISRAIKLVGVPRVFVEDGSKVVKAHFNNEIGSIITFRGTKPTYEVAECVPQELYAQLQRLIGYGYQQSGVSSLDASAQKPSGLNSGEAIRAYDDISTDRFAALARRYDNLFIDLAYAVIDKAIDIAKEQGTYQTVYPNKDGTKEIDLPNVKMLKDPFVIQCFNMSSLPRDPAGRMAKVTEMIQAGMITIKEGRRLLDYPDLGQMEKLANASEERIFKYLDDIIEEGNYTPPDPFMDLQLARDLSVQYYNLYVCSNLEEEKADMLRNFFTQTLNVMQTGQAAPSQGAMPQALPQASAMPLPQSPLVPNANMGQAPGAPPTIA